MKQVFYLFRENIKLGIQGFKDDERAVMKTLILGALITSWLYCMLSVVVLFNLQNFSI